MHRLLLTGFTPFDGRQVNASWIAANALARVGHPGFQLRVLEIPVCWGEPRPALERALEAWPAHGVVAMGEGEAGVFKLETRARNQRRERPDNAGKLPEGQPVMPGGADQLWATAPCDRLLGVMRDHGVAMCLSTDAGAYLCEEMLYSLEVLKQARQSLQVVAFVHLPPFGTELRYRGETRDCDEELLLDFGVILVEALAHCWPLTTPL